MHQIYRISIVLSVLLIANHASMALERGFIEKFCISPPHDTLCSQLPFDQADFSSDFNYMLIEKGAQDPFDVFSWQAMVALNWPANVGGVPLSGRIGSAPDNPRVWQSFTRRDTLFPPDPAMQACGSSLSEITVLIGDLVQSDRNILVDRDGNPVVYSTYANPVVADFIRANDLNNAAGQDRFTDSKPIGFPQGRLAENATGKAAAAPSVTLKMAWRILDKDSNVGRYFTRPGMIHIPAARSRNGKPACQSVTLGLVGMHIAVRTLSGHGNEWIWSTFEHVDNAPVAENARDVNSIYAEELFPGGCAMPTKTISKQYSFFDPNCASCRTNVPPAETWTWAMTAPHARNHDGTKIPGSQIVRCWDIFGSTAAVNDIWADKLKGTVWANYMLISTQWRATDKSPLFENGELPRYLTNLTLESFQQTANNGTCLGCHTTARTASSAPADFVFMMQRAK